MLAVPLDRRFVISRATGVPVLQLARAGSVLPPGPPAPAAAARPVSGCGDCTETPSLPLAVAAAGRRRAATARQSGSPPRGGQPATGRAAAGVGCGGAAEGVPAATRWRCACCTSENATAQPQHAALRHRVFCAMCGQRPAAHTPAAATAGSGSRPCPVPGCGRRVLDAAGLLQHVVAKHPGCHCGVAGCGLVRRWGGRPPAAVFFVFFFRLGGER